MLIVVLFAAIFFVCTVGILWGGYKAYQARKAQPATIPAMAVPASVGVGFTLLGALAALGFKWANDRRKRLEQGRR